MKYLLLLFIHFRTEDVRINALEYTYYPQNLNHHRYRETLNAPYVQKHV